MPTPAPLRAALGYSVVRCALFWPTDIRREEFSLNILAIETSARRCQIGLATGDGHWHREEEEGSHSNVILKLIHSILHEAGVEPTALDCIAVTHGPGSFTGLRIGIAVAQALGYATQVPVLPLSSLAMASWEYISGSEDPNCPCDILASLDARMSQIYAGWYRWDGQQLVLLGEEALLSPAELDAFIASTGKHAVPAKFSNRDNAVLPMIGSGVEYQSGFGESCDAQLEYLADYHASAQAMLSYCQHWFNNGGELPTLAPESLAPVYIRNKVTG